MPTNSETPTHEESRALVLGLTGYTPGPWAAVPADGEDDFHIGSGGWFQTEDDEGFNSYHICRTTGFYGEAVTDAHLIAAAPDLHAHLRAALDREAAAIARAEAAEAEIERRVVPAARVRDDGRIFRCLTTLARIASSYGGHARQGRTDEKGYAPTPTVQRDVA